MSNQVKQLTLSAFFLALGLVLPFAFHSFGPQAGTVFLPMHIPVLLLLWMQGLLHFRQEETVSHHFLLHYLER